MRKGEGRRYREGLHMRGKAQMELGGKGLEMEYEGECRVEWPRGMCGAEGLFSV